jgi:hypothetical protein
MTGRVVAGSVTRGASGTRRAIRENVGEEFLGNRRIARSLNARGVATARGGQWTAVQVGSILRHVVADLGADRSKHSDPGSRSHFEKSYGSHLPTPMPSS